MNAAVALALVAGGIILGGFGVFIWIVGIFSKDYWKF